MKPIYLVIPVAIVVVFVGLMVGLRLTTRPAATQQSATRSARGLVTLESIRDLLHKAADYDDCRVAVQQLNLYIDGGPEEKPRSLSPEELELLKNKDQFGLDDGELAEVNRITFTPLDGHHLELCLLLHEAVRSLRLEKLAPLDQAAAGFAWVTRQVQLRERSGDALPPDFVLRRGFGTALERAHVFLAVLQQLGIDGCMLAIPGKPGEPTLRYWLPGALIDKQIYLFDTRLGLPLPGPKGQGIATLAQLRAQPDILRQLTVDDRAPYDVSQDQARQAEIHVACVLSALAPRMRYLQERLSGTDKVLLSVDPVALVQHFAVGVQSDPMKGVVVRVWNLPGDVSSPIRVL